MFSNRRSCDYRQDIMMLLPLGTQHSRKGISCRCNGCNRVMLYGKPWNEYVLIYDGKVYCSRHCFNEHTTDTDYELEINFNCDFNPRSLRIGTKVKGIIDNR